MCIVDYCARDAGRPRNGRRGDGMDCGRAESRYRDIMRRVTLAMKLRQLRLQRRWHKRRDAHGPLRGRQGLRRRRALQRRAEVVVPLFEASAQGVPRVSLNPSRYRDNWGRHWRCLRLAAPSDFRLHTNQDEVLSFIYELRRQVFINDRFRGPGQKRRPNIYIDLDGVSSIDLEGALLLAAEIDRIRLVYRFKPQVDDAKWNPDVRALLHGLGLYRVIDAVRAADAPPIEDITGALDQSGLVIVPFVSCHEADPTKAQELREGLLRHCATSDQVELGVYDCLVEAFSNAVQHAYREDVAGDGLPALGRWWAGGVIDKREGTLVLVVYDQGVGIPKTLPRRPFWNVIAGRLPESTDDRIIEGALEYGRSGAADQLEGGRGNGLWRMCELTETFEYADVRFTSLKGQVLYAKGGRVERATLATRFCGTMVRWRATISAAEDSPE